MNPIKGTFTAEPVVTIKLEGYEPLPEMRKKSEWHGMWELRADNGQVLIVQPQPEGGFAQIFAGVFGGHSDGKSTEFTVIKASPLLLIPIKKADE